MLGAECYASIEIDVFRHSLFHYQNTRMKSIRLSIPRSISDEFQLLLTKILLKVQVGLHSGSSHGFQSSIYQATWSVSFQE